MNALGVEKSYAVEFHFADQMEKDVFAKGRKTILGVVSTAGCAGAFKKTSTQGVSERCRQSVQKVALFCSLSRDQCKGSRASANAFLPASL